MIKFKPIAKKQKFEEKKAILREQLKNSDITALNNKYDAIINKYKDLKIVNSTTRSLEEELSVLQEEVDVRLMKALQEVRVLDQKYNKSIVNKSDFDIDYYKKAKENAFLLDSLSRTINERLSAMKESIGMRR